MHKILKKWIEPYVLLETMKQNCKLSKVYVFDGFSKTEKKKEFLEALKGLNSTGLYMKNVNSFYLFYGQANIEKILGLSKSDYEVTDNIEKPFDMIDMGKAEASFLIF